MKIGRPEQFMLAELIVFMFTACLVAIGADPRFVGMAIGVMVGMIITQMFICTKCEHMENNV